MHINRHSFNGVNYVLESDHDAKIKHLQRKSEQAITANIGSLSYNLAKEKGHAEGMEEAALIVEKEADKTYKPREWSHKIGSDIASKIRQISMAIVAKAEGETK